MKQRLLTLLLAMAASLSISHAVITIDGDFSDWMMLSENDYVQDTIDENAQFTNLRNMRFTKDSECIYFYIEYTNGRMVKYLDIYMSTDSKETTGYNSPHWVNSGADFLFESDLTDTTGTVFVFASQDQNEFEFTDMPVDNGFERCQPVILANGNTAIEGKLSTSMLPTINNLEVGIIVSNPNWEPSGCIPQVTLLGDSLMLQSSLLHVPFDHSPAYAFNDSNKTAAVVAGYNYSDTIIIQESVTYNNEVYSVTSIGDSAFYNCSSLKSVIIPNSVTRIGRSAFSGCSSLTSVTIPNGVTSIGEETFYWCSSLTNVTIPNSVTSIGSYAFSTCTKLASITIPNSIIWIGEYAFENCGLISVTIPYGVKIIGEYAFSGCSSMTSISIPNSITSIEAYTFYGCGLTSLTIPDSVTRIGEYAFYSCRSLTSVTIPNSITRISEMTFFACYALKSVTIPSSVTSIAYGAFNGCISLTNVKNFATIPQAITENDEVFADVMLSADTLYVPEASIALYQAADVWQDFGQILPIEGELPIVEEETVITIFGQEVVITDSTGVIQEEIDLLGDSTLIYTSEDNTLTFNAVNLSVGDSVSTAISYSGSEPLTIILNDSSTIIADTVISSASDIIIRGSGTLIAEGVVPIIGAPTATITFDSVDMYVSSLSSPAAVRRHIRGIKQLDEHGGPALSGFATADFNKTAITPPNAEYGEVEMEESGGMLTNTINALYVSDESGTKEVLTEFKLTPIATASTQTIEKDPNTLQTQKVLIDGELFILREGKRYSIQGVEVE